MAQREALQIALEMFRNPALVRVEQLKPLPENVLLLIKLAAGEEITHKIQDEVVGWTTTDLKAAAVFYLQQVLFTKNSDEFRILGLQSNASEIQIKEHKRALLKWLHPDLNANKWESLLLQRVIKASDTLAKRTEQAATDSIDQAKINTSSRSRHRNSPYRGQQSRKHQTTRVRKPAYIREHLFSFGKRTAILITALLIALIGFQVASRLDGSWSIYKRMRDTLAWVN